MREYKEIQKEQETFLTAPYIIIIIIITTIIGSTALGGPWPPQANVASDLYTRHVPTNFYDPVSVRLPLPRFHVLSRRPLCTASCHCQDIHPASFP